MKNIRYLISGLLLSLVLSIPRASAEIILEPAKGSLIITSPDGAVKLLDFGETVPAITDNSTIEVFQGQMKITVTGEDSANWNCGGNTGSVSGGTSVTVSCGDTSGLLEVSEGEATFTDVDGVAHTVKVGETADLKIVPKNAPAAEAANEDAADQVNENSEPDSRSIEASVSQ